MKRQLGTMIEIAHLGARHMQSRSLRTLLNLPQIRALPRSLAAVSSPVRKMSVSSEVVAPREKAEHEVQPQTKALIQAKKAVVKLSDLREKKFDELLEAVGDATVVLIGEASHGTEEFYRTRAEISKQLIQKKGFSFVAVEADFPDAYRVNRWAKNEGNDKEAADAFGDFQRFPRWMWRNHATVDFVKWLREFNSARESVDKVGFYGLDLYAMQASASRVIEYLERVDPPSAKIARQRYKTISSFEEGSEYGFALMTGAAESQMRNVVQMLVDIISKAPEYIKSKIGFASPEDEYFFGEQNAKLVKDAEEYYRASLSEGARGWNIRDAHMCDTLQALLKHYEFRGSGDKQMQQVLAKMQKLDVRSDTPTAMIQLAAAASAAASQAPAAPSSAAASSSSSSAASGDRKETKAEAPRKVAKAIVWAHNSHLGDARATEFRRRKELNLGQLVRQRLGIERSFAIGQSTYNGTVSAARGWGGTRRTMTVNDGLPRSYEELDHTIFTLGETIPEAKRLNEGWYCLLRSNSDKVKPHEDALALLKTPRLQRFIGVIYRADTELASHYAKCNLPAQFDAWLHIDKTSYLKPLDDEQEAAAAMDETDDD